MSLKIRLTRAGAKKRPYYRIVVADSRAPRDGRFIEKVGAYDPMKRKDDPARVTLETEKVRAWLAKGAQPTDRVLLHMDAIIGSMTPKERVRPELMNAKRKKRVAAGSGTQVQDVNKLLKMHQEMGRAMKQLKKMGGIKGLGALLGGGGGMGGAGGMPGLGGPGGAQLPPDLQNLLKKN